ncbi:Uncharacterized protein PCOAH_00046920 [Plasmodium coatneyi]|uniref:TRAP-like protein n=1 Tax=Plasmodium coatneyi TaxID=208452 RepID=A0A1B1E459_9APIC|nr:Uncharacterized protein PCOAH_00046920 [Plasmodium coatneyi]ANQ09786.1 Uncharacterized protein PCOAH_00046920 [Plasmodium coatneyi]
MFTVTPACNPLVKLPHLCFLFSHHANPGDDSFILEDFCFEMNIHVLVSAESRYLRDYSYLLGRRIGTIGINLDNTWNYFSYSFFDDKILYTYMKRMDYGFHMEEILNQFQKDHKRYAITKHGHSDVYASLKEYYETYILNNPKMHYKKNVIIISKFFGDQEPSEYSDEFINYIRDLRSKRLGIFFYSDDSEKSKQLTYYVSEMSNYRSSSIPLAYFFNGVIDTRARVSVERFCYALENGATCARYNDWSDWSGPCEFRKRQRTIPKRVTLETYITSKKHYTPHCRSLFNYELIIREDYRSECTNEIYECRGICDEGYMFKPNVKAYEILEKYVSCDDLPTCSRQQRQKKHDEIYEKLLRMLNNYADHLRDEEILKRKAMNRPYEGEIGEEGAHPRMVSEASAQLKEKTDSMLERQHILIKNHKLMLQHIEQGDEVKVIDELGNFTIVQKRPEDTPEVKADAKVQPTSNTATVDAATASKKNGEDQSGSNTVQTANEDTADTGGKADGKDEDGITTVTMADSGTAEKTDGKKLVEGEKRGDGMGDDENAKETINQGNNLNPEEAKNILDAEEQEEEKIEQEILKDNNLDKSDEITKVDTIETVAKDGTAEIYSPSLSNGSYSPNVEAGESTNSEPIIAEENDNTNSQIGGSKDHEVNSNGYDPSDNGADAINSGPRADAPQEHSVANHNNSPVYKNVYDGRDELTHKREQEPHEESAAPKRESETSSDDQGGEGKITQVNKGAEEEGTERTDVQEENAQKEITQHGRVEDEAKVQENAKEHAIEQANHIGNDTDETTTRTDQAGGGTGEDNVRYVVKEGNINDEGVVAGELQHKQTKELDLNGQVRVRHGEEHKSTKDEKSLGDFLIKNHVPDGSKKQYELPEVESEGEKSTEHRTELHSGNYGRVSGHNERTHDTDGGIEATTEFHAVHGMKGKSEKSNHLVESAIPDGTKTEEHHTASHSTDGHILQGEGISTDQLHNKGESQHQFEGKKGSQSEQKNSEDEDANSANVSENHLVTREDQTDDKQADETSHMSSKPISEHRTLEEGNEGKNFMRVKTGKEHLVIENNGEGSKISGESTGGEIISADNTDKGKASEKDVNEDQAPYKDIREHVGQTDMNDMDKAGRNDAENIVEDSNTNDPEELEETLIEDTIISHNFGEHADTHNGEKRDELSREREQEEQTAGGHIEGEALSGNHATHNQAKEEIEEERRASNQHVTDELEADHVHAEQQVEEESGRGHRTEDQTSVDRTESGESPQSDHLADETEGRNELAGYAVKGHHVADENVGEHSNAVEVKDTREREFVDEITDDHKAEGKSKDEMVDESANVAEGTDVATHTEIDEQKDMSESKQGSNEIGHNTDAGEHKSNGERMEVAEVKGDHMDIVAVKNEGKHEAMNGSEHADIGESMNVVQSEDVGEPKVTGESADAIEATSKHDGIIESGEIGERTDVAEHTDVGEYEKAAEVEGVKREHIEGSTEEGETIMDKTIDESLESKTTEEGESFDINKKLHEVSVNPIDGTVGEELAGVSTHSAHNKKGEMTPKEHEGVNTSDRNGANEQKVEEKNEQILDYRIDDEKKASISPHVQGEVSKETNGEVKKEVVDTSTTDRKNEQTGEVSSKTNVDRDFTNREQKTIVLPEEESKKTESKEEKADGKNINEIIDNVVNTYDSKKTDSEKGDYVREKLDILEDFVESTKQVEGGKNENPYKYYSDMKTVHKIFYKKNSHGKLENDKYLIVGQNNFIIDSDDTITPFPQNMSTRVSELLKEQIQKDVTNTLNEGEQERKVATEGGENGDGNNNVAENGNNNVAENGNNNVAENGNNNVVENGNNDVTENGSGNEGGDENESQDGRRENKPHNRNTFMYGSISAFAGGVVILLSMYIYRHAQNYGFAEKDNPNNIEYEFTSEVPMNDDKGQDIMCGRSGYIEEGWS